MNTQNQNTQTATQQNKQVSTKTQTLTYSEMFTQAVQKEFVSKAGKLELTSFQEKLIQNYFIKLDQVLKDSEKKRLMKSEQNRDATPIIWQTVNMEKLSLDVVAFSSLGLDPCQKNHLSFIPFKNNSTGKYDINLMIGYVGMELKAKKYGYDVPDLVITELVYSTDIFKQFKKDHNNKIENYSFEVTNDFDRGDIIGGFYYKSYFDDPEKNSIRVLSRKDIEKRKPKYASTEFWGGEKKKYGSNEMEVVEGWEDEMFLKTIKRAAYDSIPIDSAKIDENLLRVIEAQEDHVKEEIQQQIAENANVETIGFNSIEEAEIIQEINIAQPEPEFAAKSNFNQEVAQKVTEGPNF